MDPKFEGSQISVFGQLVENELIYHSLKPVYWCTTTKTALAEAEVVYKNHKSHSIYIVFKWV